MTYSGVKAVDFHYVTNSCDINVRGVITHSSIMAVEQLTEDNHTDIAMAFTASQLGVPHGLYESVLAYMPLYTLLNNKMGLSIDRSAVLISC